MCFAPLPMVFLEGTPSGLEHAGLCPGSSDISYVYSYTHRLSLSPSHSLPAYRKEFLPITAVQISSMLRIIVSSHRDSRKGECSKTFFSTAGTSERQVLLWNQTSSFVLKSACRTLTTLMFRISVLELAENVQTKISTVEGQL